MKHFMKAMFVAVVLFSPGTLLIAQESADTPREMNCPMMQQHSTDDSHHAAVNRHGDMGMGFSHEKTTHHFRLSADGGTIEVTANAAGDTVSIGQIRSHLDHIASSFGAGDFATPMFVHDTIPPGVTTMKLLKEKVRFAYESIDRGGRVRIQSSDPVALAAIQDFLRFQITEHQTGDPLTSR
jgi:hypothetical protein